MAETKPLRVLLLGVGGVGEAIATVIKDQPWLELMVLADFNSDRARSVAERINKPNKFPWSKVNVKNTQEIKDLAVKYKITLIFNAVDPHFNEIIFDTAYEIGCNYMDCALTLSVKHPEKPFEKTHIMLGDHQFSRHKDWESKKLLALVGMGVEPGLSDVFAKYAETHLFDEIDEIGVRDGANLEVRGHGFAPTFSIWTTIEECLNPPLIWEANRGWFTTVPFSEPEVFDFPEIGPVECVNVEHEEVVLMPRWIKCKRVTFKFGLGDEFINVLKTVEMLGLSNKKAITVKGVQVAPRDVVAACLPDPATIGDKMTGKTCAGTWVTGTKDGKRREVYLYQVADNEVTMKVAGVQAVVWQTAIPPVIAMELLASGKWKGTGVLGAEAFDPVPFLDRMAAYGAPYGIPEMEPRAKAAKL